MGDECYHVLIRDGCCQDCGQEFYQDAPCSLVKEQDSPSIHLDHPHYPPQVKEIFAKLNVLGKAVPVDVRTYYAIYWGYKYHGTPLPPHIVARSLGMSHKIKSSYLRLCWFIVEKMNLASPNGIKAGEEQSFQYLPYYLACVLPSSFVSNVETKEEGPPRGGDPKEEGITPNGEEKITPLNELYQFYLQSRAYTLKEGRMKPGYFKPQDLAAALLYIWLKDKRIPFDEKNYLYLVNLTANALRTCERGIRKGHILV